MSTRNQKRKAGASVAESENSPETNCPRVRSVIIVEENITEASTFTNESVLGLNSTLENLKTLLGKEITEEMKTLLAQSQRELISAIRSSSLENRICPDDEVVETPIRSVLSLLASAD